MTDKRGVYIRTAKMREGIAAHVLITLPLSLVHELNAAFDEIMLLPAESRQVEGVDVVVSLLPVARAMRRYLDGRQPTVEHMK